MSKLSYQRQKGSAALLFLLIFPALFAVFVWGLEGARMLQTSARLKDATESAALAAAANTVLSNATCNSISKSVIESYFSSETMVSVADEVDGVTALCVEEDSDIYTVTASVTENSWFPNSSIVNAEGNFVASDQVNFRRDYIDPMDIVLVANFSGTMAGTKEAAVKSVVTSISNKIETLNTETGTDDNRIAVIGYDHLISRRSSSGDKTYDHNLICTSSSNSKNTYNCNKENNYNKYSVFDYFNPDKIYESETVYNIFNAVDLGSDEEDEDDSSTSCSGSSFNFFNIFSWGFSSCSDDSASSSSCTVITIVIFGFEFSWTDCSGSDSSSDDCKGSSGGSWYGIAWNYYTCGSSESSGKGNTIEFLTSSLYETLPFGYTDAQITNAIQDDTLFKAIDSGYGSASYTALIEAARFMAYYGENPVRKIIFVTDGYEQEPDIAKALMYDQGSQLGACSTIINHINGLTTDDGEDVTLEIFIIGLNYDTVRGEALQYCSSQTRESGSSIPAVSGNSESEINQILTTQVKNIGRLVQ